MPALQDLQDTHCRRNLLHHPPMDTEWRARTHDWTPHRPVAGEADARGRNARKARKSVEKRGKTQRFAARPPFPSVKPPFTSAMPPLGPARPPFTSARPPNH